MKSLAFTQIGEIFHSFDCMIEDKTFKFTPLINQLGDYVRCMYWESTPMKNFQTFIRKKNIEFACLTSSENLELINLLEQISEGKKKPEILIELCNYLMLEVDFSTAITKTVNNTVYNND